MITAKDYYAILGGNDYENSPFQVNEKTGMVELNAANLGQESGTAFRTKEGRILSADRVKWALENNQKYEHQLTSIMKDVSPYFQDAYYSSIPGALIIFQFGIAEGAAQHLGSAALSLKGTPSAILRNSQEESWQEYRNNFTPEQATKLFNIVEGMGGRDHFCSVVNPDDAINKFSLNTGVAVSEEDRKDLKKYHELLQRRKLDDMNMDIYMNYNAAFSEKISDVFSPTTHSTFQQLSKPLGSVVGSLTQNLLLSAVPYVGTAAAYGLAFNNQFYSKRIQALEKGWDLDKANAWALIYGSAEALLESLSIKGITRAALTSSKSIRNTVMNFVLPEGLEEFSQTLTEGIIDTSTGLDPKTTSEILLESGAAFVLGAIGGSIVGGLDFSSGQISSRLEALQREEIELRNMAIAAGIADANAAEKNAETKKLLSLLQQAAAIKKKKEAMPTLDASLEGATLEPLGAKTKESTGTMPAIVEEDNAKLEEIGKRDSQMTESQKEYQEKKEKLYAKLNKVVRAAAKRKNKNLTEAQLDHIVSLSFALVQNPQFQNNIVATVYNTADQLVKRSNWQNETAQDNIFLLTEMFGETEEGIKQREQVANALKKMMSPKEYQKFEKALVETSILLRRDFEALGATTEQADFLVGFYERMFFETALKSGKKPQEIYDAIRPTLLNLTRARLNNQVGLVSSLLDNVIKIGNEQNLSDSIVAAREAVFNLQKAVAKRNGELKKKADSAIFGKTDGNPSAKNTLNALANRALAEQRIHEDMGVLGNLSSEEWLVFALLKEQGYTEQELLIAYGAPMLEPSGDLGIVQQVNYQARYDESLQKLYPALSQEEVETLKNIHENVFRKGQDVSKSGVYATEQNAIVVGADAPISTRLEEVSHFILYQSLMDAKKRLDMGLNFNTAADTLVRRVNNLCKRRFGAFPNERQFQETVADMLHDYYSRNRAQDPESAVAIYDAISESEFQKVRSADSLYNDLDDTDRASLSNFVGDFLTDKQYRGYQSQLQAARQLDEAAPQMRNDTLKNTLLGLLEDQKNPIIGSGELAFELRTLDPNNPLASMQLADLAMRTSSALRLTAANQFLMEQEKMAERVGKNPLQVGQLDVVRGLFSTAAFADTTSLNDSYFNLNERIALTSKTLGQMVGNLSLVNPLLKFKGWLARQTMSPYHFAARFDPVIGRFAREATYKMGKRKQKSYNTITKFEKMMREGMRGLQMTNRKYWEEFVYNYIQPTKRHHDAAREFVRRVAGEEGVAAFEEVDAMIKEYKELLVLSGVNIGTVDIYIPRKIRDFDAFMEHLNKEPTHPLSRLIDKMRAEGSSEQEINDAVNSIFYAKQKWEGNMVTSTQSRQVYLVKKKDLHFYEDPFDAMVAYVNDVNTTLMMREMFGYAEKAFSKNPDFDLIKKQMQEEHLYHEAYKDVMSLEQEIEHLDSLEQVEAFIKSKVKMSVNAFAKKYADGNKDYDSLGMALYDGWLSEKIEESSKKQGVKNMAEDKANTSFEDLKRRMQDATQEQGKIGVILKKHAEAKDRSAEEITALVQALSSLGRRVGGTVSLLETVRAFNTLVVIGSKITSCLTNLNELAITASRFGLFNTIKAFREASKDVNKNLLEEIGIAQLDEAFIPQGDKVVGTITTKALQATGFLWSDRVTKTTTALASQKHIQQVLKKGDVNSSEYMEVQDMLDRVYAYDPKLDIDGVMRQRREQVEKDLKEGNVTSDTNFFMFNMVSDQQPINALEVASGYNMYGSVGKLVYQFTTTQFKQLEAISDDIGRTFDREGPAAAARKFMTYVFMAALFGVPVEYLKSILKMQKPQSLPKTVLYAVTQYAFVSEYFIGMTKKEGPVAAIIQNFTPQFVAAKDAWTSLTRNVFGDKPLKDARIIKDIPVIGELLWFLLGGGRSYSEANDLSLFGSENPAEDVLPNIKFIGEF